MVLERIIHRCRALKKGKMRYRFSDPLRALYAIHRASLKTIGLMEDGRARR